MVRLRSKADCTSRERWPPRHILYRGRSVEDRSTNTNTNTNTHTNTSTNTYTKTNTKTNNKHKSRERWPPRHILYRGRSVEDTDTNTKKPKHRHKDTQTRVGERCQSLSEFLSFLNIIVCSSN